MMGGSFRERLVLLAIGTVVTFFTFLISQYTSSFVTYAKYNHDLSRQQQEFSQERTKSEARWAKVLAEMQGMSEDIKEIKADVRSLKQ